LSLGDIERVLSDVSESIDPSALESAVREGVAEPIDFVTPLDEERFFEGVNVLPGHIVAGLPIERPAEVSDLVEGLFVRRAALIRGPSGSGKSALLWLSAYSTRHTVRWFRIRSLREADVPSLVRLAKGARPTTRCPVGFAVDDLGNDWTSGWDRLLRELLVLPGVLLLGAVREEDTLLLASEAGCHVQRPRLDENLAQALWRELRRQDRTRAAGWREAFEASGGLLLEYSHILVRGDALRKTIRDQVGRRVREARTVELDILRIVSLADQWGAPLRTDAIQDKLDTGPHTFRLGLTRLLEEHLLAESKEGMLRGLHRLRSRFLCETVHESPVPSRAQSAVDVLDLVHASGLSRCIVGAARDQILSSETLVSTLARRVTASSDPQLLIRALEGLRLAGLTWRAAAWARCVTDLEVPASSLPLIGLMASAGVELPSSLNALIGGAVTRLRRIDVEDLRPALLRKFTSGELERMLGGTWSSTAVLDLFQTLAGVEHSDTLPRSLAGLGKHAALGLSARDRAALLEAARETDPALAVQLCEDLGGPSRMLDDLSRELVWPHQLRLEHDRIRGKLRYVVPSEIPDPHEAVVELCRLALACAPQASVAEIQAVFADGSAAGIGHYAIADKCIPRDNLPGTGAILWRQRQYRLFYDAVSEGTQTDRLAAEVSLLERSAPLLHRIGSAWCQGKAPSAALRSGCQALLADAESLSLPPIPGDVLSFSLDSGLDISDPVGLLLSGLFGNVARRLYEPVPNWPSLAAFLFDTLLPQVEKLSDAHRWRLVESDPQTPLAHLRSDILDLHAAVSERAWGVPQRVNTLQKAARAKTTNPLEFTARTARADAERRLVARLRAVEVRLESRGIPVQCFRRVPGAPSGLNWPSDDILIVHSSPSLFEWLSAVEGILEARLEEFESTRSVWTVPSREGQLVTDLGGILQSGFLPLPDELVPWLESVGQPSLRASATSGFQRALEELTQVSAIYTGLSTDELSDRQIAIARRSLQVAEESVTFLAGLVEDLSTSPPITEAVRLLLLMRHQVEREIALVEQRAPVPITLAMELLPNGYGGPGNWFAWSAAMRLLLLEWDCAPEGAMQRFESAAEKRSEDNA